MTAVHAPHEKNLRRVPSASRSAASAAPNAPNARPNAVIVASSAS